MPGKKLEPVVLAVAAGLMLTGCQWWNKKADPAETKIEIPPYIIGTVAEYARLTGGGIMNVEAHGLIIGLGNNGSSEIPQHVREEMSQYLLLHKLGSWRWGTSAVSPSRVLRDKDTAIVTIRGYIPPGAPVGSRFDVFVQAMPQTQTLSLDGGILMPRELALAVRGRSLRKEDLKSWGEAGGPVFVNPFIDPTKPEESAKRRAGRIIGGGIVTRSRPLRLQLRRPDYAKCDLIQRRLNERFGGLERVAVAKNRITINLTVPRAYRDDYEYFLQLIMHLPLGSGAGACEAHARRIASHMEAPAANQDELGLVWEAMGRQVIPIARTLYASKNPRAAFYSARTGLRLGDDLAADVVLRFATNAESPLQLAAIEELGRHPRLLQAVKTLRRLVDDKNDLVRIAAYEALVKHGDRSLIKRINVGGQFMLDLVKSRRSYVIYATQTNKPRLILFGRDMPVSRPVFFSAPDDLVIISARQEEAKLLVFRKIPRTGNFSAPFRIGFSAAELIETLGSLPRPDDKGNIQGLGLTYGQVVAVLYRMCRTGDIRAKFVLQPLPSLQKFYQRSATAGGRRAL